jgi:hypothetical protein
MPAQQSSTQQQQQLAGLVGLNQWQAAVLLLALAGPTPLQRC